MTSYRNTKFALWGAGILLVGWCALVLLTPLPPAPPTPAPAPPLTVDSRPASHFAELLHLLPLVPQAGALHFQTVIEDRCGAGDWDAVHLDYLHSPQKLIYSLEDLETGSVVATNSPGEKELFETGAAFTVPVPAAEGIRHYGLFLCRDESATNRCLGKPFQEPDSIFHEYEAQRRLPTAPPLKDRVYFFRYLAAVPSVGWVSPGTILDSDGMAYRLDRYFQTVNPSQPAVAPELLKKIEGMTLTLNSVPLVPDGKHVRITLPRFSSSKCPW